MGRKPDPFWQKLFWKVVEKLIFDTRTGRMAFASYVLLCLGFVVVIGLVIIVGAILYALLSL